MLRVLLLLVLFCLPGCICNDGSIVFPRPVGVRTNIAWFFDTNVEILNSSHLRVDVVAIGPDAELIFDDFTTRQGGVPAGVVYPAGSGRVRFDNDTGNRSAWGSISFRAWSTDGCTYRGAASIEIRVDRERNSATTIIITDEGVGLCGGSVCNWH